MPRHLIHIGLPKAGSTFLQEWFARHPQLQYSSGAMGGFHSIYEVARVREIECAYYVTSAEELTSPHEDAGSIPLDLGRRRGIAPEPVQVRQAAVCATLRALFPGSTVLLVTRGFRALQRSGYSQYVKAGGIQGVHARFAGQPGSRIPQPGYHHRHMDFLIGLYREAFGAENLIVLPYELLRDDQNRFLSVLEERLGLEHVEVEIGQLNPSLSPEELHWYPVISSAVARLTLRMGETWFRRVYPRYVALTLENRLAPLIRLLARTAPGRRVTDADFPENMMEQYLGTAESLRADPLYAPYADEYLWAEAPARNGV
jgi:hypothetical protein